MLLQIRRISSEGLGAGRQPWLAAVRLAIVGCLLAAAVIGVRGFLYGDTPVLRVGKSPSALVVSPDGRTLYVTVPSGLEGFRVS